MGINRAQDYVKATSNVALRPGMETVAISDVLQLVSKCMGHQNNGRNLCFHPMVGVWPHIITDKHFLTDNLLCLVSNACKYSDRGANIDVRVQLLVADNLSTSVHADHDFSSSQSREQKKILMFSVEDTGIGINDENKKKLFRAFQQAQRRAGGTGLGLFSLAKRIEALSGTFGVRDRDDGKQGSCFWFAFPYLPDKSATATGIADSTELGPIPPDDDTVRQG
jgi:signal transduction histidine kinase